MRSRTTGDKFTFARPCCGDRENRIDQISGSVVAVVHGGTPRMRSPLAGLIATVLIFVPLVAVPVLAICGMPPIGGLTTGAPTDDLKLAVDKDSHGPASKDGDLLGSVRVADLSAAGTEAPGGHPRASNEADPFAEFERPPIDGSQDVPAKASRSRLSAKKRLPRRTTDEGNGLTQTPLLAFADASPDETG